MNILLIASEALPFTKTGGLADVAYSLPKELKKQGIDARVMIPKDFFTPEHLVEREHFIHQTEFRLGWRNVYLGISQIEYEGIIYYLIDNEQYFKRGALYGYDDDGERYAYFCKACLEAIRYIDFAPDLLHLNDWHTAAIPMLLKYQYQHEPKLSQLKTVLTIHNLKYQGVFGKEILSDLFGMGFEPFDNGDVNYHGAFSFLKAGITYASCITTVSKTYASEILHPFFGEDLELELAERKNCLHGIVNGIDLNYYNPSTDPHLFANYNIKELHLKKENKKRLQEFLGLEVRENVPLVAIVSRLVDMKGLDLMEHVIEEVFQMDIQMIVLGKGDAHFENMFKYYSQRYPERMRVFMEFNASLAQKIYAASDIFLMPSKIEPCGIGQLVALRYGTLPVVRETGGLKDTVIPYNCQTGEGTGFGFCNYNAHEMLFTLQEAVRMYYDEPETWQKIMKQAMESDHSWETSAKEYIAIYNHVQR